VVVGTKSDVVLTLSDEMSEILVFLKTNYEVRMKPILFIKLFLLGVYLLFNIIVWGLDDLFTNNPQRM
jgi:hypothetical protein